MSVRVQRLVSVLALAAGAACATPNERAEISVPKRQPLIAAGEVVVFTSVPVARELVDEQEQKKVYLEIENELSALAAEEGFELITRAEVRNHFQRELQPSDLVSEEYRLQLGNWRQARTAISAELLDLSATEGPLEEGRTFTGRHEYERTDRGRYHLVLHVTNLETMAERTEVVGPKTVREEHHRKDKKPEAFSRAALLDRVRDAMLVAVRRSLSRFEERDIRLYESYPLGRVLGANIDTPSLFSSTREKLEHGVEAFEEGHFKRALEFFEEEWALLEADTDEDFGRVARARTLWNLAVAHEALGEYPEALAAVERSIEFESTAERRTKRNKLKDIVEEITEEASTAP